MVKKIRSLFVASFLIFSSVLLLSSCNKDNKALDNSTEEISKDSSVEDKFSKSNESAEDKKDEKDNHVFEVLDSEKANFGEAFQISTTTSDVIGDVFAQISYSSSDEINLRYVFELKTLDCDISLTYQILKNDKSTVFMNAKTKDVDTVYTGYYSDDQLVTKDNTWYVVFTMRGIPTDYWDYYISVDCNAYTLGADKDDSNKIGSFDASKNALTLLYKENSSYLDSEFTFEYQSEEYNLSGYNGSETEVTLPNKALYYDNSLDDCIYLPVTKVKANALTGLSKVIIPDSYGLIEANAVSSSTVLLYEGTALSSITNNTSNTVYVYSDSYQASAWHYKNDIARLWAESVNINSAFGYNETAAISFNVASDAKNTDFNVYYSTDKSTYTKIDNELILIDNGIATAYVVGLSKGSYYFKVELADDTTEYKVTSKIQISEQDRSGYAHFNHTSGVGAYNDNGTLKDNTLVIYVKEDNKNTVEATMGGSTYTGLGNILKYLYASSNPVCIRIIGQISAATWQQIEYDPTGTYRTNKNLPASVVVGLNGESLPTKDISESEIISDGYNDLDTSVYSKLNNLTNKIKYSAQTGDKASYSPYDSYFNMADIQGANNVTIEGIGTKATIFQWGLNFKARKSGDVYYGCNNIEVRNITFTDCPEDCCSFDGKEVKTTNYNSLDDFEGSNFWVHNCTFNKGKNYWDLCYEQDKHEGDGATDLRYVKNVTFAYNHYVQNHKTGLVGSDKNNMTANVTIHHNHYDNCERRMPYARQANMHMYNNYYDNSSSSTMQIYDGAYAFIENCYFKNDNKTFDLKQNSGFAQPAVKSYNNVFDGSKTTTHDWVSHVTNRTDTVSNGNLINSTFDTDSQAFYYDSTNNVSDVTILTNTSDVPDFLSSHAGSGLCFYSSLNIGVDTEDEISSLDLNMYSLTGSNGRYYTNHVKTIYKTSDSFDNSNLSLVVDGQYVSSLTGATISGFSNTVGSHVITVDYKNLSSEYTIYVLQDSSYYNVAVGKNYTVGGTTVLDGTTYITFNTIEQALQYLRSFVTPTSTQRANLYISAGLYNEKIEIDVPYLTIKGSGSCKATYTGDESYDLTDYSYATIIEWDSLYGVTEMNLRNDTNSSQTVAVRSSAVGLVIEDLTISNWWNNYARFMSKYDYLKDIHYNNGTEEKYLASDNKVNEHRALAILIEADQFIMKNSSLLGYQDTLELLGGRQYFYNTYISGTTDYIFGTNNSTLFDNCIVHTIYNGSSSSGGYVTAFKGYSSSSSDAINYGVTFYKCTLEGDSNTVNVSLGRPWGEYSQVSYIECVMNSCISKTAYTSGTSSGQRYVKMSSVEPTATNVRFYEYGNTGSGAISSTQNGMTILTASEAAKCYNYSYIFGKNNGGVTYSLNWDPINGLEQDNNIYYDFGGIDETTGTLYTWTSTVSGLINTNFNGLNINTSKCLYYDDQGGYTEVQSGTMTISVEAGTILTVISGFGTYSSFNIDGVIPTGASLQMYFDEAQTVTITFTSKVYLLGIIVTPNEIKPTSADSLVYLGVSNAINKDEALDVSNLNVYAVANGVYYKVNDYSITISNSNNTYDADDVIDVAGTYTVTISYGNATSSFELEVVGDTVQYTYVFDFNSSATHTDTATTKYYIKSTDDFNGTSGTIGTDLVINVDATNGKYASNGSYVQFNTGTKLTFTAPYNCKVTLVSYRAGEALINDVLSTSTTLIQYFNSGTTIVILGTANGYLSSLTVEPTDNVSLFTVASINATTTTEEVVVNSTFDESTITVKAYDSTNTYYKLLSSSDYTLTGLDTSKTGTDTVTVTYATFTDTFTFTVSASVDTSISTTTAITYKGGTYNHSNLVSGLNPINHNDSTKSVSTSSGTTQTLNNVTYGNGANSNGADNWLSMSTGATISFDVSGACTVYIYYYEGTNISTVKLDSTTVTLKTPSSATQSTPYVYTITNAGTVTITATSSGYIGAIEIVF